MKLAEVDLHRSVYWDRHELYIGIGCGRYIILCGSGIRHYWDLPPDVHKITLVAHNRPAKRSIYAMRTTIQGVLIRLTDEKREAIEDMIRRFESATRYAYARICNDVPILDIEKDVMQKFDLNSRWAKDAVSRAKVTYTNAERLVEKGRLESPRKLIWGGRRNFERRSKGEITREEWRRLRSNQFWSRGDRSKGGNLNLRIEPQTEDYQLRITSGNRRWIRCRLWIPEKFRTMLNAHRKPAREIPQFTGERNAPPPFFDLIESRCRCIL